ncbi:MAG: sugar ABC transporter permease, partial [Sphaerochaeta sp.]|nr:sugar ABC transporter permease [Sphaerochaeta sp.]
MAERSKFNQLMRDVKRHRSVYVLLAIPFVYYIIFKYVPIFNGQIAFKDYMALDGVLGSRWIGLEHFKTFVNSYYFVELLRNTLMYSFGKL